MQYIQQSQAINRCIRLIAQHVCRRDIVQTRRESRTGARMIQVQRHNAFQTCYAFTENCALNTLSIIRRVSYIFRWLSGTKTILIKKHEECNDSLHALDKGKETRQHFLDDADCNIKMPIHKQYLMPPLYNVMLSPPLDNHGCTADFSNSTHDTLHLVVIRVNKH